MKILSPYKKQIKEIAPYLYLSIGLLFIFILFGKITPTRVGDGSEYYALFYAWDVTLKPWMTSISYDAYEKLYSLHLINDLMPREWIENAFPALKIGATGDFNHFWFYSFLAFLCAKTLSLIGFDLQIHESFLALH